MPHNSFNFAKLEVKFSFIVKGSFTGCMKIRNSQLINTILIVVGGAFLIYAIAVEDADKYFKIGGLIIIMLGLYRATNFWAETKDDHKKEEENDL